MRHRSWLTSRLRTTLCCLRDGYGWTYGDIAARYSIPRGRLYAAISDSGFCRDLEKVHKNPRCSPEDRARRQAEVDSVVAELELELGPLLYQSTSESPDRRGRHRNPEAPPVDQALLDSEVDGCLELIRQVHGTKPSRFVWLCQRALRDDRSDPMMAFLGAEVDGCLDLVRQASEQLGVTPGKFLWLATTRLART